MSYKTEMREERLTKLRQKKTALEQKRERITRQSCERLQLVISFFERGEIQEGAQKLTECIEFLNRICAPFKAL
ncbi:MAG: hypothetical protein JW855_06030 [Gammaproteobacteria bacterium]|nr:hypothetical protein [Gammaproteobacteria bacterium]